MSMLSSAECPLTFRLFGSFDAQSNGCPLPRLRSRKGQELLALLILRQGQYAERTWLAGVLWPESAESQALANLRLSLTDLRKALGAEANRLYAPTPRTLSFDLIGAWADVTAFDAAIQKGDANALQTAIALYRGALLEGCAEEWVFQERAMREEACLHALESLAEDAKGQNNWSAAIEYLRRVIRMEPLRENAQRALIEALFYKGEEAEAVAAYREFRLHLRTELNAAPSVETVALFQRLSQHQGHTPPHKAFTPSSPPVSRFSLPNPRTPLIGRERAIEVAAALLKNHALVTLTGSAGIGKTRLALAIAQIMAKDYPDGVAFVDLSVLETADGLGQVIGSALCLREEAHRALADTLCEHLRDKHLLLILDNCEHLTEACACLTDALVETCPNLRLLTTSRQSLGASGEQLWPVPPLTVPDARWRTSDVPDAITALLKFEAIQFFMERAYAVAPEFQLTRQNSDQVACLCRMLDGIPLTIDLAAAWIRVLPVEQIVLRLEGQLSLLKDNRSGRPARQQTLQATLNWSYNLLPEAEKALLCRLSVFVGGWTLEAAEAIGAVEEQDGSDVLSLLAGLLDKSLVLYREMSGQARYRFLETTRQYALEKLQERQEQSLALAGHRRYFLSLAFEASKALSGKNRIAWVSKLESDYENLQSALERSLGDNDAVNCSLLLAGILSHLWEIRGHYTQGRVLLSAALARATEGEVTWEMASALEGAARLAYFQYDYPTARTLYEQSLYLWQQMSEPRGVAEALRGLGGIAVFQSDYPAANAFLEQALVLDRAHENRFGELRALGHLGVAAKNQGNHVRAQVLLEQALSISIALEDRAQEGRLLHNLGNVAKEQGELEQARSYYERSLEIHRGQNNHSWMGTNLYELGTTMLKTKDDRSAASFLEQSLAFSRSSGNAFIETACLGGLGEVKYRQGDSPAALSLMRVAFLGYNRLGTEREVLGALEGLAFYTLANNEPERAAQLEGAAAELRARLQVSSFPESVAAREERIRRMQSALGEEGFTAAWLEGKSLTREQVIALATGEKDKG
jgi:predicted ATPase/DNA-binding SARP family transcriptional activator